MSVPVTPNSPPQRFSGMFSVGTHSYEPLGSVDEGEEQALQQHIEIDEDLEMFIHGYKLSVPGKVMFNALSVASGGILLIASRWFPKLRLGVSYSPCPLGQATHVYVENQWAEGSIFKVEEAPYFGTMKEAFPKEIEKPPPVSSAHELLSSVRYFEYRYIRFIFNPIDKEFVPNDIWRDVQWQKGAPVAMEGIRLQELIGRRKVLFGENALKILEKSTFQLLVDEVLHPFFMFQIGSMILWSL